MAKAKSRVAAPPANVEQPAVSVEDTPVEVIPQKVKKTIWVFVNRNPWPVNIPDPRDPGTRVTFPPCPDKKNPIGSLDYKTHPWYGNFCGFKNSIAQEPAPEYLHLREADIEGYKAGPGGDEDGDIYDLMRMSPAKLIDYIKYISESNPDIANQISKAMDTGKRISQAPPGM